MLMVSIVLDRDFGFWKWTGVGGFAVLAGLVLFGYAVADEERYWDSLG